MGRSPAPNRSSRRRDSANANTSLIAAGSGLVSAALFASAATATALAGVLFYLAPFPLCLAGLGWGCMAALVAAITGTLVIAASLGPATAAIFAISVAAPMALLTHLALLSRPVAAPATPQGRVTQTVEWYPVGRLVGWAAVMAGLLAAILVLMVGYDQDSYREMIRQLLQHSSLKELDRDGTLFTEETIGSLTTVLARALPAAFAIVWLTITFFNLWMAGFIVECLGTNVPALARSRRARATEALVPSSSPRWSFPSCPACSASSRPASPARFSSPSCCKGLR